MRHREHLVAIHANGLSELNLVAPAAVLLRINVVVWFHEWQVSAWGRRLGPVWDRLLLEPEWVAVSTSGAQLLTDANVTRRSVAVIPNPIDPHDVVAVTRESNPFFTVGYLGTPAAYKGFHILPDIIERVGGTVVRWLIFSGPQTMLTPTWQRLKSLEHPLVELPGKVHDVRLAYGQCDAILCPSFEESFGRVVAEAMANGLPVIASDLPPLRDLLGAEEAGLLVPAGDVDRFAAAVNRLQGDPELCRRLGTAGQQRVAAFSPDTVRGAFRRLYALERSPWADAKGTDR